MSVFSKPIDYRTTYFPRASLTPISGYPTFQNLKEMEKEALACLASVPTTLGGGKLGHIALGVTADKYKRLSDTDYVRPIDPKKFKATKTDEKEIQKEQEKHDEKVAAFQEVNLIERTVLHMIQHALEPTIIRPKVNRTTGMINDTIPKVFEYLYNSYGNITALALEEERQKILNHSYSHADPMEVIWDLLNEYADMAETYGTPIPDAQLISLATIVLMKANIFAEDIANWDDEENKTFQEHFSKAQATYKKSRPTETTASLGYSSPSANAVSQPAYPSDPKATPILIAEEYFAMAEAQRLQAIKEEANQVTPVPPAQSNNDELVSKLIQQMAELIQGNKTKSGDKKHKKKEKGERKYCFTHGCCAHSGADCKNPGENHKKEATFANMMGGSTKNCYWITPNSSA